MFIITYAILDINKILKCLGYSIYISKYLSKYIFDLLQIDNIIFRIEFGYIYIYLILGSKLRIHVQTTKSDTHNE